MSPVVFPEHRLAHELLDGLHGLEIGAAAYNPFGLPARNVATRRAMTSMPRSSGRWGWSRLRVDIWAWATEFPCRIAARTSSSAQPRASSTCPNAIGAFLEWDRIVRDGGYVFMIVPAQGRAAAGRGSASSTPLEHFIECYRRGWTLDTHPTDGVPGGRMGHYHTFTPDSLTDVVDWMRANGLCDWELVAREDVDSKVGNGFTLVFRVRHQRAGYGRRRAAPGARRGSAGESFLARASARLQSVATSVRLGL